MLQSTNKCIDKMNEREQGKTQRKKDVHRGGTGQDFLSLAVSPGIWRLPGKQTALGLNSLRSTFLYRSCDVGL